MRPTLLALGLAVSPLAAQSSALPPRLGTIEFPTSGAAAAQPHFIRGVLYLHSFEYESAAQEFRRAEALDPRFALAYWGEAMTYTHPVWNQQDTAAGRAALARLAPTTAERLAAAATPRERDYLAAVEILYGGGSKAHRDTLYSAAMRRLATSYPADQEAQAFYALSLLGLNQGQRDIPTYQRAGAIAESIYRKNPDHPGAVHYIIHSYDDPSHAARGLVAARAYAHIAPGAPHAQHMTTHIFLAMGMWDEVVSQNEIASGAIEHAEHARADHYTLWLDYGYLQQGRYQAARHLLEETAAHLGVNPQSPELLPTIDMRGHYLVETEQWDSPLATWDPGSTTPGGRGFWAFIQGFGAMRRNDRAAAEGHLAELTGAIGADSGSINSILALELRALLRAADGSTDEAISLMRQAAAREDARPVAFGPPEVVKPAHELLGELLMQVGRPRDAEVEFQRELSAAPKRARSLLDLGRAAVAAGDTATAATAFATLRSIWHSADADIPGRADITRFFTQHPTE